MILHELARKVRGFEKVDALVEDRPSLETGVGDDLANVVDGLSRRRWRDHRLEVGGERVRPDFDAVLLGESARQSRPREIVACDEDLAEASAVLPLLRECLVELCLGEEPLLHQQLAERAPNSSRIGMGRTTVLKTGARCSSGATRSQRHAVLLREDSSKRKAGEIAAADQDLPQQAAASPLLGQSLLELVRRHETLRDEKGAERTPGEVGVIHGFLYRHAAVRAE